MPLQCLWHDSVTLISTLLITYLLTYIRLLPYFDVCCQCNRSSRSRILRILRIVKIYEFWRILKQPTTFIIIFFYFWTFWNFNTWVCCVCKLQLATISQFSRYIISNINFKFRVNSGYSTLANYAKSYLLCGPPTRRQSQPIVLTSRWFLCSRRLKSYSEVAGLNVNKSNLWI